MTNKLNGSALNNLFNDFNNSVETNTTEQKNIVREEKTSLKNDAKQERKNKHVDLWLSETAKQKLYNDAKKNGLSINEYVQTLILER